MHKFSKLWLFALALASISLISCQKQETKPMEKEVKAIDSANFDFKVNPGEDFYHYANGTWMKNNPIPADKARFGAFDALDKLNNERIKEVCENAAKENAAKGTDMQKVGDFYASAMDTDKIEKLGATPLDPIMKKIAAITDIKSLQAFIQESQANGDDFLFSVGAEPDMKNSKQNIAGIGQGGQFLGDKDYYLGTTDKDKDRREKYKNYISTLFTLLGETPETAKSNAELCLKFETSLAEVSLSRLEMRNPEKLYNKMDLKGVSKLCPIIDWESYFKTIGMENTSEINVNTVKFFEGLPKILKKYKIDEIKTYLRWAVTNGYASALSSKFVDAKFEFYGKYMSGKTQNEPRWKRMVNNTNGILGEVVGKVYVEKYFSKEAKDKMTALVNNLKESLKERINNLDWMEPKTKENALAKLSTIMVKIGYPNKWKDYSKLNISKDSYVENLIAGSKFEFAENIKKVGKPVDREEWGMTPQTVNAYYNPLNNEIVFPAAILQPPFFYMNGDDAVNYGGIGAVIGHEITHGFDDEGRKFDKDGNLQEWWTAADQEKYKAKTKLIIDQYSKFEPVKGYMLNGELTLGENIADLGGVTIAFNALKMASKGKTIEPIDGWNQEQRFFLAYANVWRQNIREQESIRRTKEDVHSEGKFRVNGIVSNLPEFYKAFNIKQGNKLWKPEAERARVW